MKFLGSRAVLPAHYNPARCSQVTHTRGEITVSVLMGRCTENACFSNVTGQRLPAIGCRYIGSRKGEDTWRFTFILGPVPSHITLRALAEDGSVLAEQVNDHREWPVTGRFSWA
ncbi:hypothetical protein [Arthrobacter sp. OY3WO11]|uniref:hypothetical protein n=1 Tax=Arthrobacter sp. OY3WO11 TaxID=1835723 RepID=UPI00155F8021|nr:hypothetical protein [Arthrobacter sp. OY3WO11]